MIGNFYGLPSSIDLSKTIVEFTVTASYYSSLNTFVDDGSTDLVYSNIIVIVNGRGGLVLTKEYEENYYEYGNMYSRFIIRNNKIVFQTNASTKSNAHQTLVFIQF